MASALHTSASMKQRIEHALASITSASHYNFCISSSLSTSCLCSLPFLYIPGFGEITLPFSPAQLDALRAKAYRIQNGNWFRFDGFNTVMNPHFHRKVQSIAQEHVKTLGVQGVRGSNESPVIAAHCRIMSVYPTSNEITLQAIDTIDPNVIAVLLVRLPGPHTGGRIIISSTKSSVSYGLQPDECNVFETLTFLTNSTKIRVEPVSSGIVSFIIYKIFRTTSCMHVPSPLMDLELASSVEDLLREWNGMSQAPNMFAFGLDTREICFDNVINGLTKVDRARVEILKRCQTAEVFIVQLTKRESPLRARSSRNKKRRGGKRSWEESNNHVEEDEGDENCSIVEDVEHREIESCWYSLYERNRFVKSVRRKSVKDLHMLFESSVFKRDPDSMHIGGQNKVSFHRSVVVFCPLKQMANLTLSLSMQIAVAYTRVGIIQFGDLLKSLADVAHRYRCRSEEIWCSLILKAIEIRNVDYTNLLLKVLIKWCSPRPPELELDNDEEPDKSKKTDDPFDRVGALGYITVVNCLKTTISIFGIREKEINASLSKIVIQTRTRFLARMIEFLDFLKLRVMGDSTKSAVDYVAIPHSLFCDSLGLRCIEKALNQETIPYSMVETMLSITLRTPSIFPSLYTTRYQVLNNLCSKVIVEPHSRMSNSPRSEKSLKSFMGIEHILETIMSWKEVKFINMAFSVFCSVQGNWDYTKTSAYIFLTKVKEITSMFSLSDIMESMYNCAARFPVIFLAVALQIPSLKNATLIASRALRTLPPDGIHDEAMVTPCMLGSFMNERFGQSTVNLPYEKSLLEELEYWLTNKCNEPDLRAIILKSFVKLKYKRGALSLVRHMKGVYSLEDSQAILMVINRFGWDFKVSQTVLQCVENLDMNTFAGTLDLHSKLLEMHGVTNVSLSVSTILIKSVISGRLDVDSNQFKQLTRIASLLANNVRPCTTGTRLCSEYARFICNRGDAVQLVPELLLDCVKNSTINATCSVLRCFTKPLCTGPPLKFVDPDSDEIFNERKILCGIFSEDIFHAVFKLLKAHGWDNLVLNDEVLNVVRKTTFSKLELCAKLSISLCKDDMGSKWSSKKVRHMAALDILSLTVENFCSSNNKTSNPQALINACIFLDDHVLLGKLIDRASHFDLESIWLAISYYFQTIVDGKFGSGRTLLRKQLTKCIRTYFGKLASSQAEQAIMKLPLVLNIVKNTCRLVITKVLEENVTDSIIECVTNLSEDHAEEKKMELLSTISKSSTASTAFGATKFRRVMQTLKVCIEQYLKRIENRYPISVKLPTRSEENCVFDSLRPFLESSLIDRISAKASNFQSLSHARNYASMLKEIIGDSQQVEVKVEAFGMGQRSHVIVTKLGPNVSKLYRAQKYRKELFQINSFLQTGMGFREG